MYYTPSLNAIPSKSKDPLTVFISNGWDVNEPIAETTPPALEYVTPGRGRLFYDVPFAPKLAYCYCSDVIEDEEVRR